MQLDLFAEPPSKPALRWDPPGSVVVYDELVRNTDPDFPDILYDFRLGKFWHRVLVSSVTRHPEPHLTVGRCLEPFEVCEPAWMEEIAIWEFPLELAPGEVAKAIKDGAEPCWAVVDGKIVIKEQGEIHG